MNCEIIEKSSDTSCSFLARRLGLTIFNPYEFLFCLTI